MGFFSRGWYSRLIYYNLNPDYISRIEFPVFLASITLFSLLGTALKFDNHAYLLNSMSLFLHHFTLAAIDHVPKLRVTVSPLSLLSSAPSYPHTLVHT
jgi:hypothetical protein